MSEFEFESFKSSAERVVGERERRLENGKKTLSFGVGFLDAAMGGIFVNDLVLIGAKTGAGKTQLATNIAMTNAAKGKRVHYFALEAEVDEIERRIKYAIAMKLVRTEDPTGYHRSSYSKWYRGGDAAVAADYEMRAEKEMQEKYSTLHTFYRTGDFFGENFERMVLSVQDQTDLIMLDHLHYIDTQDSNENRGYKQIVKQVRNAALMMGKPVVMLAHIRKGDTRSPQMVPDIEDFHGSSDVPKISTKAIMIAPARDQLAGSRSLPTYFAPVKCRVDGSVTRYVGLVNYDPRLGRYDDDFVLGRIKKEFEPVDEMQLPDWAIPTRTHQRNL